MWIVTVENQGDKGSKFAGVSESICVTTLVGKKKYPIWCKVCTGNEQEITADRRYSYGPASEWCMKFA